MRELPSISEKISKEQVMEIYKKFVERGITSPDDLDLADPEVIEANKLFERWDSQESGEILRDIILKRRNFMLMLGLLILII